MKTKISMLAIDLAKGSFQVCAVGPSGAVLSNRAISRMRLAALLAEQPACVVAMEACATSHHWGRLAQAHGHEVRIVPAAYVKPFVKRQKNDRADAEAIAEAAMRPTMRFVAVKSAETQARARRPGSNRWRRGRRPSGPTSVWSGNARSSSMPCGDIWRSSASSRRRDQRA